MKTLCTTLSCLLLLSPALAHAGKALDDAQAKFDALSLDEAVPLFEKALLEPGSREERIREYRGLGLSRAFMADDKGAKAAFEKLLILDPDAKIDTSLGPRVIKPYEAARKAVRGKRSTLSLVRQNRTGTLSATLVEAIPMAAHVVVGFRLKGQGSFKTSTGTPDHLLDVDTPPDEDIEAYAQALDSNDGVLFQDGSPTTPNGFPAVVRKMPKTEETKTTTAETQTETHVAANTSSETGRKHTETPNAVTSAVESGKQLSDGRSAPSEELSSDEGGSRWPLWVGGAIVVIGGGAAAAYMLTRPAPLALAPADRTGQLP